MLVAILMHLKGLWCVLDFWLQAHAKRCNKSDLPRIQNKADLSSMVDTDADALYSPGWPTSDTPVAALSGVAHGGGKHMVTLGFWWDVKLFDDGCLYSPSRPKLTQFRDCWLCWLRWVNPQHWFIWVVTFSHPSASLLERLTQMKAMEKRRILRVWWWVG